MPLALATDRGERVDREPKRPCQLSLVAMLSWLACALLLTWPAARAAGAQLLAIIVLWGAVLMLALRPRALHHSR